MQKVRFVVAASAVGIACSAAFSGVAAQASGASLTFNKTLAGPSLAPMYPSGLIFAPGWPGTSGGAVVVADTGYNRISVFDATKCPNPDNTVCTPILSFGVLGSAPGELNTPRDVAVDGAHNIYVADAANSRIEAFSDTGTFLWQAGGAGKLASNLNVPIGLSYDATTNEVLVADTGHSLIKAYAAVGGVGSITAGTYIWKSPSGILKSPREVRRGPGPGFEIWVADYNNEEVKAFQCACTTTSTSWISTPDKVLGDGLRGGHLNGELNAPYNVAFSPAGSTAYVADTGNERIAVFNITGCSGKCTWVANYGLRCPKTCPPPPGNAGYFNALRRVTVDPSGNIWAADFWGSGIHEFSSTGSTSGKTEIDGDPAPAPGFAEAYGIAVGSGNLVYGVDRLNQRVEEFNLSLPPPSYVGDEGKRGTAIGDYSWPETAAVDSNGNLWVGDTRNNRLEEFSANLATPPLSVVKGPTSLPFNYIEGIAAAANGDIWVADTDNNRIVRYNPTSQTYTAFGSRGTGTTIGAAAQFINPQGVAVSSTDMYVADTGNNRIDEVDITSGNLVAIYKTGISGPQGIALAPDGSVWVANTQGPAPIVELSSDLSTELTSYGTAGTTGNSQFQLPHSLAVSASGSTLFVADTYNNRIQEYTITGS
jgi:tripartite motif-containing protein 71